MSLRDRKSGFLPNPRTFSGKFTIHPCEQQRTMIFKSKLQGLSTPTDDVFNYVFSQRNDYPRDRVLYRMDDSNETLTLEQMEEQSRQFAHVLVTTYSIKPGEVVAILASDTVSCLRL